MATRWAKTSDDAIDAAYAEQGGGRPPRWAPPRDRRKLRNDRKGSVVLALLWLMLALVWILDGDADTWVRVGYGVLGLLWITRGARAALSLYRERRDRRDGTSAVENDPSRRPSP